MKGIYKFTNKVTKQVYIGQSKHIETRWTQHLRAIDSVKFHESLRQYGIKNFMFEILEENPNFSDSDLDRLEKQYIKDYDSYNNGLNSTSGNGSLHAKKTPCKSRMLLVRGTINSALYRKYLTGYTNKNILIIGNFKICDTLTLFNNNLTIITDDYDFECEDAKQIIRVDTQVGIEELMSEINKIEKNQFDLIIANPPYQYGNKIISKCVDKAKESIVLMPISCYKSQDLYKHIIDLELVDPGQFEDAAITNNLNIARLCDRKIDQSWEQVELETFDLKYRAFYELNSSCYNYAIAAYERVPQRSGIKWDYDTSKAFAITARTARDGVHKVGGKGAFDLDVNIYKTKTIADTSIWKHANGKDAQAAVSYIYFKSTAEKDNLVTFWYYNPIMDRLLRGLNKCGGDFKVAIPNIDWAKDRDYEHCTLDDIMTWLREDNNK